MLGDVPVRERPESGVETHRWRCRLYCRSAHRQLRHPHCTAPAPGAQSTQAIAPKVAIATEKTISLPGIGGHGDEVVVDPGAHAAYIAQSPDNDVVVIDTASNNVKAVVPQVANANGIAFSDSYVFVAEADAGAVAVIDKPTWKVIATVPSGGKTPDAVYYDPRENSIFVANDDSNNMQEFSAAAPFSVQGTLNLDPAGAKTGPDLGTYSSVDDKIYQSDDNNVDVIDAKTRTIQKVITPLSAGATAKDMYFDQAHHLLWVGTSDPMCLPSTPTAGRSPIRSRPPPAWTNLRPTPTTASCSSARARRASWVSSTSRPTRTSLMSKQSRGSIPRVICPVPTSSMPTSTRPTRSRSTPSTRHDDELAAVTPVVVR